MIQHGQMKLHKLYVNFLVLIAPQRPIQKI